MSEKIKQLVEEFNKFRADFQEKSKASLKEAFVEFFKENPTVAAVRWNQFTPYFNDGDECTFSKNTMEYKRVDADGGEDWIEAYWADENSEAELKAVKEFDDMITDLPEDVFKDIFGDHTEITATAEGFEVEEYSHD